MILPVYTSNFTDAERSKSLENLEAQKKIGRASYT